MKCVMDEHYVLTPLDDSSYSKEYDIQWYYGVILTIALWVVYWVSNKKAPQ